MADTIVTRRDVAKAAREFGRQAGLDYKCLAEGARGRVNADLVFQYLLAQPAANVRTIAGDLGVEVSAKGKISETEFLAVVDFVTKNAPKEAQVEEAEAGE